MRPVVVSLGWIVGILAGALVLLAIIVGGVWLLTRPPSPESEVRAFLTAGRLDDSVTVGDCRSVRGDSTLDFYRCDLNVDGRVRVETDVDSVTTLSTGTYCFRIPRSGSETDADPELSVAC